MIAEEDFDHTIEEDPVRMADSVHAPGQDPEVVHLARIEVDPVDHMEVDRTGAFGYPEVVRIEVDSEADQTEVADDFLGADHIAVAEAVHNSLG